MGSAFEAAATRTLRALWARRREQNDAMPMEDARDEASVFGEPGRKWAIPEEHERAHGKLLDAARAASGFTWPEMLDGMVALNANASSTPTQIIFAPTLPRTTQRREESDRERGGASGNGNGGLPNSARKRRYYLRAKKRI
jgi:hypothetical protein